MAIKPAKQTVEIPATLIESIREQRVVLFLGAGASLCCKTSAGVSAPRTEDIRKSLAQRFLGSEMAGYDLMTVAEMAIQSNSQAVVYEHVRNMLEPLQPSSAHLLVPRFRWRMIATTNYDTVLEKAYARTPESLQTLVPFVKDREPVIERMQNAITPVAYEKLHGSIDHIHDPEAPPVLSHEHYAEFMTHRRMMYARLEQAAQESPILFCGYSLADPHIRKLLYTFGKGKRPSFYIVAPKSNEVEIQFWQSQNVVVVPSEFEPFMAALDSTIAPLFRAPAVRDTTVARPIRKHFRTNSDESDRLDRFLGNAVDIVRNDIPHDPQSPKKFYEGFDTGWGAIKQKLDVVRGVNSDFLYAGVLDEASPDAARLFVFKGAGGSGKTIALKRAAWDAANDMDQLVLWRRGMSGIDFPALQELYEMTGKRIYLFVDRLAENVQAVNDALKEAKAKKLPLTIVGAERTNEWNVYCGVLDEKHAPTEFRLPNLSRREVEDLVERLEKHGALGLLSDLKHDQRVAKFETYAEKQLLVALHEATRGVPFEDILNEEYLAVPDSARQLYLDICTLNQFAVPVRAGTISRVSGIRFTEFETDFFAPLEHLIFTQREPITGDWQYKARHSLVAKIVFDRACSTDEEKAAQFVRLIHGLDIGFSTDLRALSDILRGRTLADQMANVRFGREIYEAAINIAPDAAFVLQQWAIFESQHPEGALKEAERLSSEARTLEPRNNSIIHTQAEVARKSANATESQLLKDQYRRQARDRLDEMRPKDDRFAMSSRAKLLLDELTELAEELSEDSRPLDIRSFEDKIRDAETAMSRALQLYPDDPELLQTEARFRTALSQRDKAVRALEKAWVAKPRGSGVAIRLARIYQDRDGAGSQKAQAVLAEALERQGDDRAVHLEMARYLIKRGNPDWRQINDHLQRSYAASDNNHEGRFLHAQALFASGEARKSGDLFEVIGKSAPAEFRKRAPSGGTDVSKLLPVQTGRVVTKSATYLFAKLPNYVENVYCPLSESDDADWEAIRVGSDVSLSLSFCRTGPVGMNLRLRNS